MTQLFNSATDFRKSLESRLKKLALAKDLDLQRLRRKVAFDRLLARLFSEQEPRFFLKGGYAMELRLSTARATKDIDLTSLTRVDHQGNPISQLLLSDLRSLARKDLVCLLGSPNLRTLAMKRYIGLKEGLSLEQILSQISQEDTIFYLDTTDANVIQNFENQRKKYYQEQLKIIENVTILDPGPRLEHSFCIDCYQKVIESLIGDYRNPPTPINIENVLACATI
jgi:hypothetical protein